MADLPSITSINQLPDPSSIFVEEDDYICTGKPGTGFFVRKEFQQKATPPVPIQYAGKYLYKYTYEQYLPEEPHDIVPTPDNEKVQKYEDNFLRVYFIGLIASLFSCFIWGWFIAFWVLAILSLICKLLDNRNKEKSIYNSHKNWADIPPKKEEVREMMFQTPELDTQTDYYIDSAVLAASSINDDIYKQILEAYAQSLRNPGEAKPFDADATLSDNQKEIFAELSASFERLILNNVAKRENFRRGPNPEKPTSLDIADAALYLGQFNNIATQFYIPTIDMGDFQIYFYPAFMLMVFNTFTFHVIRYTELEISTCEFLYPFQDGQRWGLVFDSLNKQLQKTYKFLRIRFQYRDFDYSIDCSSWKMAQEFADNLLTLRNSFN